MNVSYLYRIREHEFMEEYKRIKINKAYCVVTPLKTRNSTNYSADKRDLQRLALEIE